MARERRSRDPPEAYLYPFFPMAELPRFARRSREPLGRKLLHVTGFFLRLRNKKKTLISSLIRAKVYVPRKGRNQPQKPSLFPRRPARPPLRGYIALEIRLPVVETVHPSPMKMVPVDSEAAASRLYR